MKKFLIRICLFLLYLSCIYPTNTINAKEINKAQNQSEEDTVSVFSTDNQILYLTQSDINLLAKLVYAESRGEPFEGKVAVASVVLNRVIDSSFPNTVSEVIFQKNAFSCVVNGSIKAHPDSSCYDAVKEAIRGKDPTNEALFFYNPKISTSSWMINIQKNNIKHIGNHIFFRC